MKLMKGIIKIALVLCVLGLASCSNHDDNEEKYYATPEKMLEKTFFDLYGAPASGQTWNTAAKRVLSVTVPASKSKLKVSVYTADPLSSKNNAIKLAEYSNLQASQVHQLAFDGPASVKEVYVAVQDGTYISVSPAVKIDGSGNCNYTFTEELNQYGHIYSRDMQYIIAYEDLGVAVDLDYNDIVLGVTHVSGQDQVKVRLWALGTLIYAHVFYNDTELFEQRELHDRLCISNNTTANVFTPGNIFTLEARANSQFSLATFPELQVKVDVPSDFSIVDNATSFIVKTQPSAKAKDEEIKSITVPTKPGSFPFAILIADPDWCWPTETTSIHKAYPNFVKWVTDPTLYNWYK